MQTFTAKKKRKERKLVFFFLLVFLLSALVLYVSREPGGETLRCFHTMTTSRRETGGELTRTVGGGTTNANKETTDKRGSGRRQGHKVGLWVVLHARL